MYLDQAKADFERSRRMVYEVMSRDDEEHALYLDGKKPEVVVRGCTEEEVAALERRIGYGLPAAYREFLLWMGHSGGYFEQSRETFYRDLEGLQEYAPRLLKANHITTPLPNDTFVFFVLRGFFFFFFRLSEGDNPPVYFYCDSDDKDNVFRLYFARYSDYLESQLYRSHRNCRVCRQMAARTTETLTAQIRNADAMRSGRMNHRKVRAVRDSTGLHLS